MPKKYSDYILYDIEGHMAYISDLLNNVPKDFKDVTGRDDEAEWKAAIYEELHLLVKMTFGPLLRNRTILTTS